MPYQTTIPASQVSESKLIELINQIEDVTQSDILLDLQFVIRTEDVSINLMLESLAQALHGDKPTARGNGHKPKKSTKVKSGMTSHQVRIDETKEILSKQAFNKRLAAGDFSEFTTVTNAKGEQFVVVDGKLVKGPQS